MQPSIPSVHRTAPSLTSLPSFFLSRLSQFTTRLHLYILSFFLCLARYICQLSGWTPYTSTHFAHKRNVAFARSVLPCLYAARGTPIRYRRYASDAVFEDPLLRAQGREQIAAAFDALRWLFRRCQPVLCDVLVRGEDGGDDAVLVLLVVDYVTRGLRVRFRVFSTVSLQFARDGAVLKQEERWFGLPLISRSAFFGLGTVLEVARGAVGVATYRLVQAFPPPNPRAMLRNSR